MKICIYTSRSLDPLHPRLDAQIQFFIKRGFEYKIVSPKKHLLFTRINWFSLWIFDYYTILKTQKEINSFDTVFIQDLRYLPIAKYAKKKGKKVIYETLDNNVFLRLYDLSKRFSIIKHLTKPLSNFFTKKEKRISFNYCDKIIVNSKALHEYFKEKSDLIFYSSLLENANSKNDPRKPSALLYLGAFTKDKGAIETLELQAKLNLDLFIIGTIFEDDVKKLVSKSSKIRYFQRIGQSELAKLITEISEKYFIIGLSLIKPVNYSFSTQEANKDIDYLALGIPIIGNHRKPTEEKVLAGCGVFLESETKIEQLITDSIFKDALSINCKNYYNTHYSIVEFYKRFSNAFSI